MVEEMDLSDVDVAILVDLYENLDDVPANIADRTGHHPNSVSRCLTTKENSLEDRQLVESKGHGVWRLTDRGKEMASKLRELRDFDNES